MRTLLSFALVCSTFLAYSQSLVSSTEIDFSSSSTLNFVANGLAEYNVRTYKFTYNTVDLDGNSTVASGAISLPANATSDSLSMIAYHHGTVLADDNVPSANNNEALIGKILASTGFVSVMPDYLGLGDNAGDHPYLHQESQATATLDLIDAAREYLRDSTQFYLNNELYITGYSQGGHAAMSTAKYAQENNLLGQYPIKALLPASGPYHFSKIQADVIINDPTLLNPGFYAYFLNGQNPVFNFYNNPSEYFKSPYDQLVPKYTNGNYPFDSLNLNLPNRLSLFLRDSVRQNFINDSVQKNHPIWKALLAADNHNWKPNFPTVLYYCSADQTVSPNNTQRALNAMKNLGANVQSINNGALSHGNCVLPSVAAVGEYIDTTSISCTRALSLANQRKMASVEFYPNPVKEYLRITELGSLVNPQLKITDLRGQVIYQGPAVSRFDTQNLASGVYIVTLQSSGERISRKIVKQ